MTKLADKFEAATCVILVMPGGKQKMLPTTQRKACAHALRKANENWERRCAMLYQVIGSLAFWAGIFGTSQDVSDALDVAAGRGDMEKLLPWPKHLGEGKNE